MTISSAVPGRCHAQPRSASGRSRETRRRRWEPPPRGTRRPPAEPLARPPARPPSPLEGPAHLTPSKVQVGGRRPTRHTHASTPRSDRRSSPFGGRRRRQRTRRYPPPRPRWPGRPPDPTAAPGPSEHTSRPRPSAPFSHAAARRQGSRHPRRGGASPRSRRRHSSTVNRRATDRSEVPQSLIWWRRWDSNPRPPACKPGPPRRRRGSVPHVVNRS